MTRNSWMDYWLWNKQVLLLKEEQKKSNLHQYRNMSGIHPHKSTGAYESPDAATGGGMVSGLEGAPLYGLSVLAGVVLALWAKHVWPAWRDSMTSQSGQWRTESGFVKQLSAELDRALVRADEADTRAERAIERAEASDRRADKYFMELAEMKTQVKLLTYQLKVAHEKIDLLTARLNQVIGRDEELESTKRVISGHKP